MICSQGSCEDGVTEWWEVEVISGDQLIQLLCQSKLRARGWVQAPERDLFEHLELRSKWSEAQVSVALGLNHIFMLDEE